MQKWILDKKTYNIISLEYKWIFYSMKQRNDQNSKLLSNSIFKNKYYEYNLK